MARKGTVLVVDDEADLLTLLGQQLTDNGYNVRLAHDGREGLEAARQISPDLLILDINMPGIDGMELKTSLNQDEATAGIPTIFLSASAKTNLKVESFRLGAEDYIAKPFNVDELMARVDSTLLRHQRATEMAMTDKLTGLNNLHVYKKQAACLFNSAKRYGRSLSLAILDVDNLKTVNDTKGHQAGDEVIKKVAERMKLVFRQPDILIRYGGDEFVVLFPESSEEQAAKAIHRFKQGLDGFSVSCGLASYKETILTEDELFAAADKNLYQEKTRKKSLPA